MYIDWWQEEQVPQDSKERVISKRQKEQIIFISLGVYSYRFQILLNLSYVDIEE